MASWPQNIQSLLNRLRAGALRGYRSILFCVLAAIPVVLLCWIRSSHPQSRHVYFDYVLLLLLAMLSSSLPVYISDKRFALSPTLPMTVAAYYIISPLAALSIGALSSIFSVVQMTGLPRTRRFWKHLCWSVMLNVSTCILANGVPLLLIDCLVAKRLFPRQSLQTGLLLSAAAVCSFYISAAIHTTYSSYFTKSRWDVIWYQSYRWTWISTILLAPLGFLMGALIEQNIVYGLLFILMPLFAVHEGYARHEREIGTYRQGIDLLGRLMQESHPYTHGHLNRVATWAVKIAEHLNLGAESMAQIENAAILHDIGKIAIDDGILNKVEKLSDDEWNKIKDHPSVGAEIAARMKYLEQVSLWIRHHHERVDGKGYPAGLSGNAIPIESKIICVVDAFDAMVGGPAKSDQRPYRLPKSVDEARTELVRCSGTQFDEIVVNAFLAILDAEAAAEMATFPATAAHADAITLLPAATAAIAAATAAGNEAVAAMKNEPASSALAGAANPVVLQEAA